MDHRPPRSRSRSFRSLARRLRAKRRGSRVVSRDFHFFASPSNAVDFKVETESIDFGAALQIPITGRQLVSFKPENSTSSTTCLLFSADDAARYANGLAFSGRKSDSRRHSSRFRVPSACWRPAASMCATPLRRSPRLPPEQPLVRRVEWLFGDRIHLFPVFNCLNTLNLCGLKAIDGQFLIASGCCSFRL
jgi:hypothetical protein